MTDTPTTKGTFNRDTLRLLDDSINEQVAASLQQNPVRIPEPHMTRSDRIEMLRRPIPRQPRQEE